MAAMLSLADAGFEELGGDLPLLTWSPGHHLGIRAVWTSRHGGVSTGAYRSLNLGGSDDPHAVLENQRRVAQQLGMPDLARVRVLKQVHGADVVVAPSVPELSWWNDGPSPTGDALLVESSVGGAIFTADCMSIVIADAEAGRAVALHAGWKGIAAGVIEAGVQALQPSGSGSSMLTAAIGPSLGACCFDASPELARAIGADGERGECEWREARPMWRNRPPRHGIVHPEDPQPQLRRLFVDAPAVAKRRLIAAGICAVDVAPLCTACDGRWFSYRADGPACGRQALIVLPESQVV